MPDNHTAVSDPISADGLDKRVVTQPWEDYDTVLRHAERARMTGDAMRARTYYSRLAELNPNDPRGWSGLAETAASLDEAIMSWAYVIALTPNNWEARTQMDVRMDERIRQSGLADAAVLVALARTLIEVGQKLAADRVLVRATELDPTNAEAWLWRAGVTDDPVDAIDSLKQVLSIDPENAQAKAGLKWALAKEKKSTKQVCVDDVKNAAEFFEEGQKALRVSSLPQAHDFFKRATELDPHNESAWFWRGSTTQDVDEAVICMDRTLALNPQNQAAKDTRWWLCVKKYREFFGARKLSPPSTPEDKFDQLAIAPPLQRQRVRYAWLVLLLFVFVLISLGVAMLWRLG